MIVFGILSGCSDKVEEIHKPERPVSFTELLNAYKAGKVIDSVNLSGQACVLSFTDGYKLTIPSTEINIHDCTETRPPVVEVVDGWWSVGGVVYGIKADTSVSDELAAVVFAYFNNRTLYIYLSNRNVLEFSSKVIQEEENENAEIERRQNIPVVRIETEGGAGIYDKKNYVPGVITVLDPEKLYSDVVEFSSEMGIRGRGNSTWSWPKKPWKVKLEEKAELLGMPADKEWALLANYSDRTLLRNIVAMRLSEICGFSWTPRMHSVEVYLNGEYQGVYTLCEHKKISKDRVAIDEETAVYLEIEESMDETTVWSTSMGVPMMFSEPEVPSDEQLEYIKNLFDDFEAALYSNDHTAYEEYVDVDSFIDYYIVQELTKNIDGNLRKSSFITKEVGKKLEMYHLWDFDLTLGNCGYFDWRVGNGPENFWIRDFASNCTPGDNWINLMMKDPGFMEKLEKRWNELLPEFRNIPDFIDRQALYLQKAQKRNFEVWSIHESVDWVKFPSLGSYEKEVEYLKEFYTERLEWLDKELF